MDLSFVWCQEEDDHQKRLATLVAEVSCRSEVPRVVTADSLTFPEDLDRFYFV